MRQLASADFSVDSYVTGIYDKLENSGNEMHLVWFSTTNKELYYMRCDFTSASATAIRLYTDITSIMETVFVGTTFGTIAG